MYAKKYGVTFKSVLSFALVILTIFLLFSEAISIRAAAISVPKEVKGKTIAQVLKMKPADYINNLLSHEDDKYYLGTPYMSGDHRNPKGDCKKSYGKLDKKGVAGMNCTGFVWHALYKATAKNKGNTKLIPNVTGWYDFYVQNNISRRYFSSKKAMLESGYLEKGDIIWMYHRSELTISGYHHMGIYWGDGKTDVLWHSSNCGTVNNKKINSNVISKIIPFANSDILYVAIKVGAPPIVDGKVVSSVSTPKITSFKNYTKSTKITWDKVEGAYKYRLFVKKGSSWKKLTDTFSTTYTHKDLIPNTKYKYTVRCLDSGNNYVSSYNKAGFSNTLLSVPKITSTASEANGVKIKWQKVSSADKYRVYIKSSGSWRSLGVTKSTSYTDKNVKSGKSYTYTVRCYSGDSSSYYNTSGVTHNYIATPKVTSIKNYTDSSKISWSKADGAYKYRVFVKNGSSWKKLGDTKKTSFSHTGVKSNTKYKYTVRCLNSKGKYISGYIKEGFENTFMSVPKLTSAKSQSDGIKITWNNVSGAEKYRVFVKFDGSWKSIGTTSSNFFVDTNVDIASSYTYTVYCCTKDGKKATSYYNKNGISCTHTEQQQETMIHE
ncbi:MAG: hypothetical protein E7513_07915 [Ruminococcaceae bacterium]|nr:hypothetical protein [Oscillospiraceae bacterium]